MRILIKNGTFIDGVNQFAPSAILAVDNGSIQETEHDEAYDMKIDASGCIVMPGLVDFHVHVFDGGSEFGFNPDLVLSTGVTSLVDMGTSGYANIRAFANSLASRTIDAFAFLNISAMGQMGTGLNENLDPALVDESRIMDTASRYGTLVKGLKVRISRNIVGTFGIKPLEKAIDIAEKLSWPVCVHVTDPCVPMEDIADLLRPRDIICHMYHGKGWGILDDGKVSDAMWKARERGIVFDAANGRTNFDFSVAEAAIRDGFLPQIISSDMTRATVNKGIIVRNLPFVMSKYLSLGMSLPEIVKAVSATPRSYLDADSPISQSRNADIAIMKIVDRETVFRDSSGNCRKGNQILVPLMTIKNGDIVFDNNELPREVK